MGQIVGVFEQELIGMEVGEEKSFTLQPGNAYGDFDPLLVKKVGLSQITEDVSLELGREFDVVAPNGMTSTGWIRLIEKDFILVDLNHPYAGKVLNFKVKILETDLEPDPVQNPFNFGISCGNDCDHH
jgi:FKBP-type peptidyl-prolyl cis-trans isomerase 2